MIHPAIVIIGAASQAIGGISYLLDTLKGKIKPNKVTWLLWSVAPLVAFAAEVAQGVGIQSLTTFIVGFVPLTIFIASFVNRKSGWKLGRLDIICGGLSFLGIALWMVTKVGNVAIFFSIVADALAAVPTIVKSYSHPESENDLVYLLGIINAAAGLIVIPAWNFEHWGYPAYLFLCNGILFFLIRFKLGKKI